MIVPDGDIVEMAIKYLPEDHGSVLSSLHARRLEVRRLWEKRPELSQWVGFSARWMEPPSPTSTHQPPTLYFAYGANMSAQIMNARCPNAKVLGPGRVLGFRLAFAGHSSKWGGYVATLIAAAGQSVQGLVYDVPPAELESLDQAEGQNYQRLSLPVESTAAGGLAHVYVMAVDDQPGMPSRDYLNLMKAEYERHQFDVLQLLHAMAG